jgi:hypothetical protein
MQEAPAVTTATGNCRSGRHQAARKPPLRRGARAGVSRSGCREPAGLLPTMRRVTEDGLTLRTSWEPSPPRASDCRSRRPCHPRATSRGHEPYPAASRGSLRNVCRAGRPPLTSGVEQAETAWHEGGQGLYRPCRARLADRSLVAEDRSAEASATRRDRCSRDCSRDAPRHPGMSEYRMGRRYGVRPA